ncbi:MAG: hypothetical protein P1U36_09820 [Legionellaceae bacterium]|nr:hypothetical protein [Legionellaceae bacterium]
MIKKILQHPKCPENLSFEITLTSNHGTYACGSNRTRTPLAPIFKALASGKCTTRGLKIKLVGGANHVLSHEMEILVKGLKEGKCPNNLQIDFGALKIFNPDTSAPSATNDWSLLEALQSPHCPSGLSIQYRGYKETTVDRKRDNPHWNLHRDLCFHELARLCTSGSYDRENIQRNISKIYSTINKELSSELSRLGEKDAVRKEALEALQQSIHTICEDAKTHVKTCDPNATWKWKDSLRTDLEKAIKTSLDGTKLDKHHTDFEKFGKHLLNIITGMLFPLALIKYAATGNAFFSTVGKTHEAVEKTLDISKNIK